MFLVLSKNSFFFSIKRQRVHPEQLEETSMKRAPGGGSKYYRFWKHRGDCKIPAQEPARVDAEQSSGGSQRGHPTEREI